MAKHNELGKIGENIASNYLMENGYQILDRNWIFQNKELDIIAMEGEELVVVEVKYRSTEYFEHPAEAITLSKIKFLVRATQAYVDLREIKQNVRFDVIGVVKQGGKCKIEHIKDAFIAPID